MAEKKLELLVINEHLRYHYFTSTRRQERSVVSKHDVTMRAAEEEKEIELHDWFTAIFVPNL